MSHTQAMENSENKTNLNEGFTKEEVGVMLSRSDAEEYRAYKRQRKIAEITAAIARSESPIGAKDDARRIADRAARFRQAAVRVTPSRFLQVRSYLPKNSVGVDCIVGGNGETLAKAKAYEAKIAKRLGARELTVVVTPSLIATCRFGEIKKELRRIKRAAGKTPVKVWVEKGHSFATIARLARIACEVGAKYFCVPYFAGCERLRYDLSHGCLLEVSEVETLEDFKKMTGAGVGRIVTTQVSEIFSEWMKEAENIRFCTDKKSVGTDGLTENKVENAPRAYLAASDLKFV